MLNKTVAKIIFYMVAIVLFTWTASLTVSFLQSVLPDSFWLVPYLGLVVFDGGLIAWMIVFLSHAQGGIQRATALLLTVFNLIGVGLMVIAEILLDGQTWVAPPESLGTVAVWAVGLWTIANVAGVVIFHLGDNEARKEMAIQSEKDAVFEGALKELGKLRATNQARLAADLSASMYSRMVADLNTDADRNGIPDIMERGRQSASAPPQTYTVDDVNRLLAMSNTTHTAQPPQDAVSGPVTEQGEGDKPNGKTRPNPMWRLSGRK